MAASIRNDWRGVSSNHSCERCPNSVPMRRVSCRRSRHGTRPSTAHLARRGVEDAGEDLDRRRLPGAVGPDVGDPLAGLDGERDAAHRLDPPPLATPPGGERLAECPNVDGHRAVALSTTDIAMCRCSQPPPLRAQPVSQRRAALSQRRLDPVAHVGRPARPGRPGRPHRAHRVPGRPGPGASPLELGPDGRRPLGDRSAGRGRGAHQRGGPAGHGAAQRLGAADRGAAAGEALRRDALGPVAVGDAGRPRRRQHAGRHAEGAGHAGRSGRRAPRRAGC